MTDVLVQICINYNTHGLKKKKKKQQNGRNILVRFHIFPRKHSDLEQKHKFH